MSAKDFLPKPQNNEMAPKQKKVFELLPSHIRNSEQIQKFFDDAINQWFTPENSEKVNGYIGKLIGNSINYDVYADAGDPERFYYQLSPIFTSVSQNGDINQKLFYPDVVNYMKYSGSITDNHQRLFDGHFYSYAPPVNIDMLLNYPNYYWVKDINDYFTSVYDTIVVKTITNPFKDVLGTRYAYPIGSKTIDSDKDYSNVSVTDGDIVVFDNILGTRYKTGVPYQLKINEEGTVVEINDVRTDFINDYVGKDYPRNEQGEIIPLPNGLFLSNGQRLRIRYDISTELNYNEDLNRHFIVSGVGKSIQLIPADYNLYPVDTSLEVNPEFIVMERGAKDGNLWSRTNNWVHVSIINQSIVKSKNSLVQSNMPIIEYFKDIHIHDYGVQASGDIDYVIDVDSESLLPINFDLTGYNIGDTILFREINPDFKNGMLNRVYIVTPVEDVDSDDELALAARVDQTTEPNGDHLVGNVVYCRGDKKQYMWDGFVWSDDIQQKGTSNGGHNQYIYFSAFDSTGEPLENEDGQELRTTIFQYKQNNDKTYVSDIEYNQFGEIMFENTLDTDFTVNAYYKIEDNFKRNWIFSNEKTKQPAIATYSIETNKDYSGVITYVREYELPYQTTKEDLYVVINEQNIDTGLYEVINDGKTLKLDDTMILTEYDVMDVVIDSTNIKDIGDANFRIPRNLTHNPLNQDLEYLSTSDLFQHFVSIISSQNGFEGNAYGVNNYNDSPKDNSLGTEMIKQENSMIPLMLHASDEKYDIINAIEINKREYIRFYNKFKSKLTEYYNKEPLYKTSSGVEGSGAAYWINKIINDINIAKNDTFPFWYTGMIKIGSCIPATSAYIGITRVYKPDILTDKVLAHDGTHIEVMGDGFTGPADITFTRDDLIYEFEKLIYESIDDRFKANDYYASIVREDTRPGYWRTTDYTWNEYHDVANLSFREYVTTNEIPYYDHDDFSSSDWKTWNWSATTDLSGENAPGNYKGIMTKFYDSIDPSNEPWRMLGIVQKPIWWDTYYGDTAPNAYETLWDHIKLGFIAEGNRFSATDYVWEDPRNPGRTITGIIDSRFARPDINVDTDTLIPVDTNGNLRSPFEIGLVDREPTMSEAAELWKLNDYSDMEVSFIKNVGFTYEWARISFLLKPTQWASYNWSTLNYLFSEENGRYLDRADGVKETWNEQKIHTEDGQTVLGYQVWTVDSLIFNNYNIDKYARDIHQSDVRLGYKLGGYTGSQDLTFQSDSFGLIPTENRHISLYKSNIIKQVVYSGVNVIIKDGEYEVYGFDNSNTKFNYYKPVLTGKKTYVNIGGKTFIKPTRFDVDNVSELPYRTRFKNRQEVYEFILGYGEYLKNSGWIFEDGNEQFVYNWETMAEAFLMWSIQTSEEDSFINLSPAKDSIKYFSEHGSVQSVTQFTGGSWSILDSNYKGISTFEIDTARIANIFALRFQEQTEKSFNLVKLNIKEYEHCVIFDNKTNFGDNIYIPKIGLYQERFKMIGNKTSDWNGRLEGAGFIILEDGTLPNFEKLTEDFRKYYDYNNPANAITISELSREFIGYQTREYLSSLVLDDVNKMEVYKGYIRDKGTRNAFEKFLAVPSATNSTSFQVHEEWAIKTAEYGATQNNKVQEFRLRSDKIVQTPQLYVFGNGVDRSIAGNSAIYFSLSDEDWVTKDEVNFFPSIDPSGFLQPVVYDSVTDRTITRLNIWHPELGYIPGKADNELRFSTEFDPAQYNNVKVYDGNNIWGERNVGQLWWDKSKIQYAYKDIQDIDTRRANWGKGTGEVVVYEWVKSPVEPDQWENYVENSQTLNKDKSKWFPTGEVFVDDSGETPYCSVTKYDPIAGKDKTFYYFWVKNPSSVPDVSFRSISAARVKQIINDPTSLEIPWFCPIFTDSTGFGMPQSGFVISGLDNFVTNDNTILQLKYKFYPVNEHGQRNDSNVHKEWLLLRERFDNNMHGHLWKVFKDGILGYSEIGSSDEPEQKAIPYSELVGKERYGNSVKIPGQSIFMDITGAREVFIQGVNNYYNEFPVVDSHEIFDTYLDTTIEIEEEDGFINKIKMSDYWEYKDWYAEGYDSNSIKFRVKNLEDRNNLKITNGDVVLVENSNGWTMYEFVVQGSSFYWNTVGSENRTIQLKLDKIIQETIPSHNREVLVGDVEYVLNNIFNTLNTVETRFFINAIKFVLSEQQFVDWIFKTSYVYITGLTETLNARPISNVNETEEILKYFNEVKPYRTKIRNTIEQKATELDIANLKITDEDTKIITLLYDNVSGFTQTYEFNLNFREAMANPYKITEYKKQFNDFIFGDLNSTSVSKYSPHIHLLSLVNRLQLSNPDMTDEELRERVGWNFKGFQISDNTDIPLPKSKDDWDSLVDYGAKLYEFEGDNITNKFTIGHIISDTNNFYVTVDDVPVSYEINGQDVVIVPAPFIQTKIKIYYLEYDYFYDRLVDSGDGTTPFEDIDIRLSGGTQVNAFKRLKERSGSLTEKADVSVKEGFEVRVWAADQSYYFGETSGDGTKNPSDLPLNWMGLDTHFGTTQDDIDRMVNNLIIDIPTNLSIGEKERIVGKQNVFQYVEVNSCIGFMNRFIEEIDRITEKDYGDPSDPFGNISDEEYYVLDAVSIELTKAIKALQEFDWADNVYDYHMNNFMDLIQKGHDAVELEVDYPGRFSGQKLQDYKDALLLLTKSTTAGVRESALDVLIEERDNLLGASFEIASTSRELQQYIVQATILNSCVPNKIIRHDVGESLINPEKLETDLIFGCFSSANPNIVFNQYNNDVLYSQTIVRLYNQEEKYDVDNDVVYYDAEYYTLSEDALDVIINPIRVSFGKNPYTDNFIDSVFISEDGEDFIDVRDLREFSVIEPTGNVGSFDYGHDASVNISDTETDYVIPVTVYAGFRNDIYVSTETIDFSETMLYTDVDRDGNVEEHNIPNNGTGVIVMPGSQIINLDTREYDIVTEHDRPTGDQNVTSSRGFRMYLANNGWQIRIMDDDSVTELAEDLNTPFSMVYDDQDVFSQDSTYSLGSKAWNAGQLYECITDTYPGDISHRIPEYNPTVWREIDFENPAEYPSYTLAEIKVADISKIKNGIGESISEGDYGIVWVNDECIYFGDCNVAEGKLLNLRRGLYNTISRNHKAGTKVSDGGNSQSLPSLKINSKVNFKIKDISYEQARVMGHGNDNYSIVNANPDYTTKLKSNDMVIVMLDNGDGLGYINSVTGTVIDVVGENLYKMEWSGDISQSIDAMIYKRFEKYNPVMDPSVIGDNMMGREPDQTILVKALKQLSRDNIIDIG